MKNMSDINIVLDRSGSMGSCRGATIESFNGFLDGQVNGPDEAVVSLYCFDHEYEPVYEGREIDSAPRLSDRNYIPRGSTALLDAIGRTIDSVGARLSNTPEYKRPSKVIVVIVTDGLENASKEYTRRRVFDMIKHQEDVYNWTFIYLGANQDAYHESAQLGFSHRNTLNFAPNRESLKCSTQSLSTGVMRARATAGGQSLKAAFSAEDQAANDALAGKLTSPPGNVVGQVKKAIDDVLGQNANIPKGERLNIRKRDLALSSK